jgi:superfamily II DNA or RNA helicase
MDKARNRSTILFASSIEDSKGFVEKFSALGVVAAHVDGTTESQKRQEIFNGFRCGKIQMLCNVGVATEGTDLPIASALILANPTKSLTLHHQMVGRGLRIHPESGKEDCIILDHVGNHQRLGWIDDTIEWTLDCKKKVRNITAEKATTPIRTCPVCYFAMRGGSPKCERCGHEFVVKKRELVQVDTKLREAQRKAMPATNKGAIRIDIPRTDPLGYYAESLRIAKELGYRPGWASARFNAVFGKYPRFDPDDVKIRIMELEYERSCR